MILWIPLFSTGLQIRITWGTCQKNINGQLNQNFSGRIKYLLLNFLSGDSNLMRIQRSASELYGRSLEFRQCIKITYHSIGFIHNKYRKKIALSNKYFYREDSCKYILNVWNLNPWKSGTWTSLEKLLQSVTVCYLFVTLPSLTLKTLKPQDMYMQFCSIYLKNFHLRPVVLKHFVLIRAIQWHEIQLQA